MMARFPFGSLTARLALALVAGMTLSSVYAQDAAEYGIPVLEGRAVLPADTFADGPASGAAIQETNGRVPPFEGQPVQGISNVLPAENGNWYAMQDNGFGAKGNSADINLRFYEVAVDWEVGSVEVMGFTELSDPNNMIEFPIQNQDTEDRILTGADFDLESFRQAPDGSFWFGEEFGPFLLHTAAEDGAVGLGPIFKLPFQTIELVWPVDADTLLVEDDNNYPFSSGRRPGLQPDDTEFILIGLPEALPLTE